MKDMRGWIMEIFKLAKEIEKVYNDLIENTKKENLREIEKLKKKQEKDFELLSEQKQELINSTLKTLSDDLRQRTTRFKEAVSNILETTISTYEKEKENLINSIINELKLDFDA